MTRAYRCSAAAEHRGDGLEGTASTVRSFLLLEHAGPWGVEALLDSRMPAALGRALHRHTRAHRVRPLLIRRPGRGIPTESARVFAVRTTPQRSWTETTVVPDLEAVLEWDLGALASGRSLGLEPHPEPLLCVCTHGRHDRCCAERGRPLAAALASAYPDQTWECSHIGGDRFAGNVLLLPDGLYYGRLDPDAALRVAAAHAGGRLVLDHLRGRSTLPMPVQAAEIGLRRHLGEERLDALRFLGRVHDGALTAARFAVDGTEYVVAVRSRIAVEAVRLTCQARVDNPVPAHEVVSVTVAG